MLTDRQKNLHNLTLENYFEPFRKNVVGYDLLFDTPFGKQKMIYADWTASGRAYGCLLYTSRCV